MNDKVYQVNLKEHLEKYVWKRMRKTEGFFKTIFMRKSQYYVDINWGYLKFEHETEKPRQEEHNDKEDKDVKDRKDAELNTCEEENKTTDEQIHKLSASRETKATQTPRVVGDNEHTDVELYTCEYENKTDDEQTHRFTTSRETTATMRVELQENYTLGAETNIEVNIGCVKVGGKVNGGLSVTKTDGQEYSKSLTWSIDTEIKVPAKQRAIAKLHVNEYCAVTDFTVKTTVTLPKKKMPVSIRRLSDNKLIYTVWIQNIDSIFDNKFLKRAEDVIEVICIPNEAEKKTYIGLILKSRGTCHSVSFRNQNVTVECKPLSDEKQLQTEETKCPKSYEDRDKDVTQDSIVNDHVAEAEHDATVPKSVDGALPRAADDTSATVQSGRLHQDDGIPKIANGSLPHETMETSKTVRNGKLPHVADVHVEAVVTGDN